MSRYARTIKKSVAYLRIIVEKFQKKKNGKATSNLKFTTYSDQWLVIRLNPSSISL